MSDEHLKDVANDDELTVLHSFFDAFDAGEACRYLEAAGLEFELVDRGTSPSGILNVSDQPVVRLDVEVRQEVCEAAKLVHRRAMHLFPEREISDGSDDDEDQDAKVQVATCEDKASAEEISSFLVDAGIPNTLREISDEEEGSKLYLVDVGWDDVERALATLDRWKK